MNNRNKTFLSLLLMSILSLSAIKATPGNKNNVAKEFKVTKKDNTYTLKSGDKTAELCIKWRNKDNLNQFSVISWPGGVKNDPSGQNLKTLAVAFLTLSEENLVHVDYKHKKEDPDIDTFLSVLTKKHLENIIKKKMAELQAKRTKEASKDLSERLDFLKKITIKFQLRKEVSFPKIYSLL